MPNEHQPLREKYEMTGYRLAEGVAECQCGLGHTLHWLEVADFGEWFSSATVYRVIKGLEAENAAEERAHEQTLTERDEAIEAADRLAYSIGTVEEIGEHSNCNNPWEQAHIVLQDKLAELTTLRAKNASLEAENSLLKFSNDNHCYCASCRPENWPETNGWRCKMSVEIEQLNKLINKLERQNEIQRRALHIVDDQRKADGSPLFWVKQAIKQLKAEQDQLSNKEVL